MGRKKKKRFDPMTFAGLIGLVLALALAFSIVTGAIQPGILEGEQLEAYEKVLLAAFTLLGTIVGVFANRK